MCNLCIFVEAWPSGKAEACKASIPSSNLGASFMLNLVATPIGNLKDFTFRALEVLQGCDTIYCEDTRTSLVLLHHYQIKKKLESFHKFNEASLTEKIANEVREGKTIGIISDAGVPGLSDPGEKLIRYFAENDLPMTLIPGPSSVLTALVLSGFKTSPFQFVGFLDKGKSAYEEQLKELLKYPHTSLLFETPHHIDTFFEVMESLAPDRKIAIARELTKKFECVKRGVAKDLKNEIYKGEIVVAIEGFSKTDDFEELLLKAKELINLGLSKKDASEFVTRQTGVKKRDIYQKLI